MFKSKDQIECFEKSEKHWEQNKDAFKYGTKLWYFVNYYYY